jgi:hypothetical protein
LISACASPYQAQRDAIKASYQRGELKANDYYARMNELEALELQQNWLTEQSRNAWKAQVQRQEIIDQNQRLLDRQRQQLQDHQSQMQNKDAGKDSSWEEFKKKHSFSWEEYKKKHNLP